MRVLRSTESIHREIVSCPDPHMAQLLARHVEFLGQYDDDSDEQLLSVIVVEPGDTLQAIDREMECGFLANPYSGRRFGDPGFQPSCETLEEHATFYEMFFIQSDEGYGLAVLIPKRPGIDPELLSLCARHATTAPPLDVRSQP